MANELPKGRRDWRTIAAIISAVVAFVSMLIAAGSLRTQFLSPFRPSVLTSPPAFLVFGPEPAPIAVVLTVTFANHGAKPGCFWDLALEVTAKTVGTKWVFFPTVALDYSKLISAPAASRLMLNTFTDETFTPIALPPRQQVEKVYLLMPRPPKRRPGHIMTAKFLTETESYGVDLYAATKEGDCGFVTDAEFVKRTGLKLEIQNPDALKDLPPGSLVSLIDKDRDDSREGFLTERIR